MKKLQQYLSNHSDWMLILDGCGEDAMTMLTGCMPRIIPSHDDLHGMVVITTSINESRWKAQHCIQYRPIEVKPFTPSETKDFVCRYTADYNPCYRKASACKKLYEITAGSPALLRTVLDRILVQGKTVDEFLATMRSKDKQSLFKHKHETEFKEIQCFARADILLHILCFYSPYTGVPLNMFKAGLLKALEYATENGDECHHVKELRELTNDLVKALNDNTACSILKDGLKIPHKYEFVKILGKDLKLVQIPKLIQRSYLQFTEDSEASRCCRESQFPLKIACLCLMEAMRAESSLTQQLTPHLKHALAWDSGDEQPLCTATFPVHIVATLARHYVEGGMFKKVINLLATLNPSAEELQNQETMTCFIWLARSHLWLSNLTRSIRILKIAATACEAPEEGVILTHLACAETEAGLFYTAKYHLDEAQKLLGKTGVPATTDDYFHLGLHEGGTFCCELLHVCQIRSERTYSKWSWEKAKW